MCGIAGWLARDAAAPVDVDVLARMRDAMRHRGPDGEGLWTSADRQIGLAFRRLAIIDLSTAANQPMANEDGTIRVVFNGEIYNHRALRAELEAAGHRFRTDHSDTETIVHGYEQWGADVVHHLHGMFAIGVWDAKARRLFVARDRIGIKPLYFTEVAGSFLFASEIKSLVEHPSVSVTLEPAALYHYLSFLATPAPMTMFRGIYKMPAGHRAVVDARGVRVEQYWDALPSLESHDVAAMTGQHAFQQAVMRTGQLVDAAVAKRLMSDVPFGALLSGGIDSSLIVALMSKHLTRPVRTFTVGFSDHRGLNELDEARFVAETFKTEHHEVMVDERVMREYLPQLVHSQDEPLADWVCIPLYFVSKLVRDSGTVVVQVGEGSDEEFCGYASYMGYLRLYHRYWRPFQRLPAVVQSGVDKVARSMTAAAGRGALYADIINRAARRREHFWGGAVALWESMKAPLVRPERFSATASTPALDGVVPPEFFRADTYEVVAHHLASFDRAFPDGDVLARMTYLEFKQRLPELLLMRVDKISMSTSVEARVPFLDHELVEFTMGLPIDLKVGGGVQKKLLKQVARGVIPDQVIDRRKQGFGAPMKDWLRGAFGREAEATVLSSPLRSEGLFRYDRVADLFAEHRAGQDRSLPIWILYNLTAWYDRWFAARA